MAEPYRFKIQDGDDVAWDLPRTVILPKEPEKYGSAPWREEYTWFKLSHMIYGSKDKVYLLLAANNLTNPWSKLDQVRFLMPDFVKEVILK
jgi:hypothetical protein